MMMDEMVMDDVVVKEFETLKEAEDFLQDCEDSEIEAYGETLDDLWIEEI